MTNEYLEFLTENSQRKYPLLENCSPDPSWPDAILLDLKGFSRDNPEGGAFLVAYSGHSSTPSLEWTPPAGNSSLFFRVGKNSIVRVDIPSTQNLDLPFSVKGSLYSGIYQIAGLEVTIGSEWSQLSSSDAFEFGVTAPLESCAIIDLYRQQVDRIGILHSNSSEEEVSGDVVLRGGYNVEILQRNGEIIVSAIPGAGELGEFLGDGSGDECRDNVYSINGMSPNSAGSIKFVGGRGIDITSSGNTVTISLDTSSISTNNCS